MTYDHPRRMIIREVDKSLLLFQQWWMDRLDAMRIYAAVARLGSFAKAARQLRLSPSVVTRSIAQLEDQLGVTLLTRTTRSVRVTDRGEIYLESCQQILEDIEGAGRRVRGENAEPRGDLKVAAPIAFGRLHVLPVVNRMLTDHRALSVRLTLSDRNALLVDEGVDVAVRIGELADSSLIAVKLGAVSRVLVASPAYLARHGAPSSPADLAALDAIAFESLDATNEWRFSEKAVRLEPRLSVNSADAAIAAAEAGIGIARAPLPGGSRRARRSLGSDPPILCAAAFSRQRGLSSAKDRVGERGGIRQNGARSLQGQPCRSPGRVGGAARGLRRRPKISAPTSNPSLRVPDRPSAGPLG
ncbi:MAG: LysR substrate-binding domain-containing protein [Roseiarcus sp.]